MKQRYIMIATLAGLIAVGAAAGYAKSPDRQMRFDKIDANGDGSITLEEITAHRDARFTQADANGDGFLTPDEMRGGNRAKRMMERLDTNKDGVLDSAELEAGDAERMSRRVARMLERIDADGDGKVSMEEASARRDPARMFERLDADGNGSLSAEEFAKAGGKRRPRAAD